MFYLVLSTFIIIRTLRQRASQVPINVDGDSIRPNSRRSSINHQSDVARDNAIHRLTYRLIGYVVITSVSYTIPGIGFAVLDVPGFVYPRYTLLLLNAFGIINGLEGVLNGICSMFDPAMIIVYRQAYRDFGAWLSLREDKPSTLILGLMKYEGGSSRRSSVRSNSMSVKKSNSSATPRILATTPLKPVSGLESADQ